MGNGVMIALEVPKTLCMWTGFYAAARAHGAVCEGPPGWRGEGLYAADFRDTDGDKLNSFMTSGAPG